MIWELLRAIGLIVVGAFVIGLVLTAAVAVAIVIEDWKKH